MLGRQRWRVFIVLRQFPTRSSSRPQAVPDPQFPTQVDCGSSRPGSSRPRLIGRSPRAISNPGRS